MSSLWSGEGRAQRRDMLETIEEQKATIHKYENRLRDLVRAYKGLTQEKDALDASLKAIQATTSTDDSQPTPSREVTPGGGSNASSRPVSPTTASSSETERSHHGRSDESKTQEEANHHQVSLHHWN